VIKCHSNFRIFGCWNEGARLLNGASILSKAVLFDKKDILIDKIR